MKYKLQKTEITNLETRNDSVLRSRFKGFTSKKIDQNPLATPKAGTNVNKFVRLSGLFKVAHKHKLATRTLSFVGVFLIAFGLAPNLIQTYRIRPADYNLNAQAKYLLGNSVKVYADKLHYTKDSAALEYNPGYKPGSEKTADGLIAGPRFSAKLDTEGAKAYVIKDVVSNASVSFTPKFSLATGKKDENRVVYPIRGLDATKIITLKAAKIKEDIIVNTYQKDKLEFVYEIGINEAMETRLEADGSIGIYGASTGLLGDVTTTTPADEKLLKKARQASDKNKLLFRIPAPFVVDNNRQLSKAKASYKLEGSQLTITATDLDKANYPISIDPSVYIETAAKLMRGNNETNTDFDIDDELIQKSQTTGARINAWQDNLDMTQGTWDHGVAAAGGYIYRVGGRTDPTKPSVLSATQTLEGSGSATFTMSMPSTRPAGDLYIAMMCHDGSDGGAVSAPSGWTQIADLQGYIAYYKIGTDQGGGNEAASYDWGGYGSEEWAGTMLRITGFNSSDPVSGTPSTTSSGSNATPTFPATTPDSEATLVIRGAGWDQDDPSVTGWVPSGHTKLDSSSSSGGGNGSCGFAAASLDTPPASGVSTGTATFADASVSDDYGSSSIAINPAISSGSVQDSIYWAKFNSTTLAIESPNPGTGACSGWCTDTDYDLPEARRGHSVVSYNGYLYAIGGSDGTNLESTVFIAKLGANGEPQLWHPTDTNKNNWVYWYQDTGLNGSTARAYHSAVAYNNRMYIVGGDTNTTANSGSSQTVEIADILPNGRLGTWSAGQSLPSTGRYGHSVQVYNDVMYLIGGNNNGTQLNSVYYSKLNSNGTMNSWTATTSFTTARSSQGGTFTAIWGAYIYLSGGCTAVNASGYCTSLASDTQIGSLNADGTISEWGSVSNLVNQRMGYSFIGWQNGLYRLGGCATQNTSSGICISTVADVDYGVVNPAGEVSTVSISVASGTSPCSGGSAYNCDLPPAGDDAGEAGQMLSMTVVLNGYFYVIGGCIAYTCDGNDAGSGDDSDVTGNTAYTSINSNGQLSAPGSCGGTSYGAWCVDNTNKINNTGSATTDGVAAGGVTVFGNRVYIVGGFNGNNLSTNIYYNDFNSDGSLNGAWESADTTDAGITEDIAYTYAYARANPATASTYPGDLFVFGGCGTYTGGAGCGSSDYETEVYKCNITTAGAVETGDANDCETTNQLQIDSTPGSGGSDGLGTHSGTVYANYIYLIGGLSQAETDKDDVLYAKFDDSNNVVDADGETIVDNTWIESPNKLSVGRRRGFSFGYNGHIYSTGGYDGSEAIPFIEWAKMNVSDGSIDEFVTSSIQINQRWGLSMAVSNAYAYVIGGCDVGSSPSGCSSFERSVQIFQIYNNDSGALNDYTAQGDDTFATDEDRWGVSSAILNGYIYVAGGCISATDCTDATNDVQYASISAADGTIGTWTNASNDLPADRAWGSLEVAGGFLYYLGGQDDTSTNEQSSIYYVGTFSSGNISAAWSSIASGAAGNIGDVSTGGIQSSPRTKFSSTVWNNRIYIVGGLDGSAAVSNSVLISPQLNSGGAIAADSWTSDADTFDVARTGAALTAYANNLYLFGGFDGTNYLSDSQFTQINTDGTIDAWTFSSSLPGPLRDAKAVSANGYIYLIGGRSAATTCAPNTLITPISANTTIATGNNPTGTGEWYETNVRYASDRYGAAVAYEDGRIYLMGGGCSAPIDCSTGSICNYQGTVKSQPQVAIYSRMIDTDTDVFPTDWLMNGVDNSIGARWQLKYRSMHDLDTLTNPNEDCGTSATMAQMTTWGQETNVGDVTLGTPGTYTPVNSSGGNINCARYFFFYINIDASKTFGYPEDVTRGPTITDLSLFFTSDPSKRMRHGKTFTGGEQQPLDTPF